MYHVPVTMELDRHAMSENSSSNLVANAFVSVVAIVFILDLPFFLLGHWIEKYPRWMASITFDLVGVKFLLAALF
jgi:hypothetical protein